MKLEKTSNFASWVIDLRDGALQIQRVFNFSDEMSLNCFMVEAGRYMKVPNLTVAVDPAYDASMSATVIMNVIPESSLLAAAGDMAHTFEGVAERIREMLQFAA